MNMQDIHDYKDYFDDYIVVKHHVKWFNSEIKDRFTPVNDKAKELLREYSNKVLLAKWLTPRSLEGLKVIVINDKFCLKEAFNDYKEYINFCKRIEV